MADNKVQVGPWGGNGGEYPWSFLPDGRITKISIRSGYAVDAISFTFINRNGSTCQSLQFGGNGGGLHEIPLANDEEIISIRGRVGVFDNVTVVTSLTFVTNRNTYGQYGKNGGTDFSLPVTKGKIVGFYGRHGLYLDSIGVIISP